METASKFTPITPITPIIHTNYLGVLGETIVGSLLCFDVSIVVLLHLVVAPVLSTKKLPY